LVFIHNMNNWVYYFLPFFTAFTGWLANWSLLKFAASPRFKAKLSGQLVEAISNEFQDSKNLEKILPLIDKHIDDFLRNKLPIEIPMVAMFVGDKTIITLKQSFLKEMQLLFPEVMKGYVDNLKDKMEPKLKMELRKKSGTAGLTGALVGFVSGLILVAILLVFP